MKIQPINIYNFAKPKCNTNTQTKLKYPEQRDEVCFGNRTAAEKIIEVKFDPPIAVKDTITEFIENKKIYSKLAAFFHPKGELLELQKELQKSPVGDTKVKELINIGGLAFAFRTEDEECLKLSLFDHFAGRKPCKYDLPIRDSGELTKDGEFYYYFEEIVDQKDLKEEEILNFVKKMENEGYKLFDIYNQKGLRLNQFGKTKNGEIYLVDPGCIIEGPNTTFSFWSIKRK